MTRKESYLLGFKIIVDLLDLITYVFTLFLSYELISRSILKFQLDYLLNQNITIIKRLLISSRVSNSFETLNSNIKINSSIRNILSKSTKLRSNKVSIYFLVNRSINTILIHTISANSNIVQGKRNKRIRANFKVKSNSSSRLSDVLAKEINLLL